MDYINPKLLPCAWPFGCKRNANGFDHDHLTDIVRAALCSHHNAMLADAGDQPTSLRKLADWLECANLGFLYSEHVWARGHTPEYMATKARQERDKRMNDPEFRDQYNAQRRERNATDPEYRERNRLRNLIYNHDPDNHERKRLKRMTPEYRARKNELRRARRKSVAA